jgi:hypothetical protein
MKTPKLYDSARHPKAAANVVVIGKLTIIIHSIDRGEVCFVLNPNIEGFAQGRTAQELSFSRTDDTVLLRLSRASPPVNVSALGTKYTLTITEIGSESMAGVAGSLDYVAESPDSTDGT